MVGLGFGKQGGSKTKGGIPLFFFAPPLAGGCEKKSGVRKERGVHAPRAPPLNTLVVVIYSISSKFACYKSSLHSIDSIRVILVFNSGLYLQAGGFIYWLLNV